MLVVLSGDVATTQTGERSVIVSHRCTVVCNKSILCTVSRPVAAAAATSRVAS